MTIKKTVNKGDLVIVRTFDLRWEEVGGFRAVTIGWYSIQTPDAHNNKTWVYLTPKVGKVVSVEVASLKDGLALVKALGGVVK